MAKPAPRRPRRAAPVPIELALQGGGAHGAFTWGVLHRLLDEPRLAITALSGASAGAMNAVVLADGWLEGGAPGAQRALWRFWKRVSRAAHAGPAFRRPFARWVPGGLPWSPPDIWSWWSAPWITFLESVTRSVSPYQFNPLNLNPLGDILREMVDFPRLAANDRIRLFLSATDVRTGALRVFRTPEITAEVVLASACLPNLFQAVELGGEAYWDGGYLGNPPLLPLVRESAAQDLLLVQLNPPRRTEVPRSAEDIFSRLNEITFNATLVQELEGLALLRQGIAEEGPGRAFRSALFERVRTLRLHRIAADEAMIRLGTNSKLNPEWQALIRLHGLGHRAAEAWLAAEGGKLGVASSFEPEAR
ncbi:MAG: patatin-like phospholipase family protein [Rubritepida sp.]|jgi:NTE family protein|nr:patatin-like phospholipase family protein [Rubritepida sp.]MCU0943942.1 patatin-like phospholipase family protein [Rubritepida sp.]